MVPATASAQVAGSVSLASAEIFRGESLAGTRPTVTLAANYDHLSGFFAGASASAAPSDGAVRIISANEYAGYGIRRGRSSFEIGVIHRDYRRMLDTAYRLHYFEGFVGVAFGNVRARVYVSPDYLRDSRTTYYGEVNARLWRSGEWSLNGHVGVSLIPEDKTVPSPGIHVYRDWSIQIDRPVGRFSVSAGVAQTNYPVFRSNHHARVYASISRAF